MILGPVDEAALTLPLVTSKISATFAAAVDDHAESFDLAGLLNPNPAATYLWRVAGECMIEAGIYDGDLLLVDRSISPRPGHVVVATVAGETTLKRLVYRDGRLQLIHENKTLAPFKPDVPEFEVWGVARLNIHWLGHSQHKPGTALSSGMRENKNPGHFHGADKTETARGSGRA